MKEKKLYLSWQDRISRGWFVVGKLMLKNGKYTFNYTKGTEAARGQGFRPFLSFPELEEQYVSEELFPMFANRLMNNSREDYPQILEWLNLPRDERDPFSILGRNGGRRATDSLELFPHPSRDEQGRYHIHFFSRGVRHFPDATQRYIDSLSVNTRLFICKDVQNSVDSNALLLRTEENYLVGWCPRYLTEDFNQFIDSDKNSIQVTVEVVNPPPAPLHERLLCEACAPWPKEWEPMTGEEFADIELKDSMEQERH